MKPSKEFLKLYENMKSHIGHKVEYYQDSGMNYGTILRINIRPELNSIEIWLNEKKGFFHKKIYLDNLTKCECGRE